MDIRGDLDSSILVDVIDLLASIKISGTLTLDGEKKVDIYFKGGEVVGGASDSDEDFIDQIISLESGNYYFSGTTVNPKKYNFRIDEPIESFVHKITKKIKGSNICSDIYHDDMVFELSKTLSLDKVELSSEEWRVLALLSSKKSVHELRTNLGLNLESMTKILYSLEQVDIIRRTRTEKVATMGSSLIKKIKNFLERFSHHE